jgi:hypothetical protein
LGVQNYHGTRSALKGHPLIKNNGKLETPWETSLRELFEEISIKLLRRKIRKKLSEKHIVKSIGFETVFYLECNVDSERNRNDRQRRIGLFVICVTQKKLSFTLTDTKENQVTMNTF